MNKEILELAKKIARQDTPAKLEEAGKLILDYLVDNPRDTQAWLLLARIECNPPLYDPYRIIEYSNQVLAYDPNNSYALLFLAYAQYYLMGEIDEETHEKLCLAESDDRELMSMIEIAKARYYKGKGDMENFEKALKRSIEYYDKHLLNFCELGTLYLEQGKIEEGKRLINKGLGNAKRIFPVENEPEDSGVYDPTNISALLNEFYAQTTIGRDEYNYLKFLAE